MSILWTIVTIGVVVVVLAAAAWAFLIGPYVVPNRKPRAR